MGQTSPDSQGLSTTWGSRDRVSKPSALGSRRLDEIPCCPLPIGVKFGEVNSLTHRPLVNALGKHLILKVIFIVLLYIRYRKIRRCRWAE